MSKQKIEKKYQNRRPVKMVKLDNKAKMTRKKNKSWKTVF